MKFFSLIKFQDVYQPFAICSQLFGGFLIKFPSSTFKFSPLACVCSVFLCLRWAYEFYCCFRGFRFASPKIKSAVFFVSSQLISIVTLFTLLSCMIANAFCSRRSFEILKAFESFDRKVTENNVVTQTFLKVNLKFPLGLNHARSFWILLVNWALKVFIITPFIVADPRAYSIYERFLFVLSAILISEQFVTLGFLVLFRIQRVHHYLRCFDSKFL